MEYLTLGILEVVIPSKNWIRYKFKQSLCQYETFIFSAGSII